MYLLHMTEGVDTHMYLLHMTEGVDTHLLHMTEVFI